MRLARWTQHTIGYGMIGDAEFPVIVVGEGDAEHWARALTYALYEGLEWAVVPHRLGWIVGHPPGRRHDLPNPEFWSAVEAPEWVWESNFDDGENAPRRCYYCRTGEGSCCDCV